MSLSPLEIVQGRGCEQSEVKENLYISGLKSPSPWRSMAAPLPRPAFEMPWEDHGDSSSVLFAPSGRSRRQLLMAGTPVLDRTPLVSVRLGGPADPRDDPRALPTDRGAGLQGFEVFLQVLRCFLQVFMYSSSCSSCFIVAISSVHCQLPIGMKHPHGRITYKSQLHNFTAGESDKCNRSYIDTVYHNIVSLVALV